MEENLGVLSEIFLWHNFIISMLTTNFLTMFMEECKTMALGEDQPMFGKIKEFAIHIGKKLVLVMVLMSFLIKTIHAMDGL